MPVDPVAIAEAARQAIGAGAALVHVHPRDRDRQESLAAADVSATIQAIRQVAPDAAGIGVTTGLWVTGDAETQIAAVGRWERRWLPDLASVNFDEPAPEAVCAAVTELGIGVEAGLSSIEAAERFMRWRGRAGVARILVEPMEQEPETAIATAQEILKLVSGEMRPTQVHGYDNGAWPVLRWAAGRSYEIRAGFEDMLHLPSGDPAPDNASLVTAAVPFMLPGWG